MKPLNNIYIFLEFPFYDELNIGKTSKALNGYAHNYNNEIIDSKDPSIQLILSRSNIEDSFKELLAEIKGFKYEITLKVLLIKYKGNEE